MSCWNSGATAIRWKPTFWSPTTWPGASTRSTWSAWKRRWASGHEPPQLLITIEEAHKFLDPKIAGQTIFGTIAREMRKYNVTLLVVDQRPSGIDEEVMCQIGRG